MFLDLTTTAQKSYAFIDTYFVRCLALTMAFVLPFSTVLTTVCVISVGFFWLLTLNKQKLQETYNHDIAKLIFLFLGVYACSSIYSAADLTSQLLAIKKISKLLLIPILIPYFHDEKWRRRMLFSFCCALLLSFIIGYCRANGIITYKLWRYAGYIGFKDSIITGFFVSVCCFILMLATKYYPKYRFIFLSGIAFLTYFIFFINSSRMGYLLLPLLYLVFLCREWKSKNLMAISIILVATLVFAILNPTSMLQNRVAHASEEIQQYKEQSDLADNRHVPTTKCSAIRLEMYKNTLPLILEAPLFGHGIGSFSKIYNARFLAKYGVVDKKNTNPHNQYLLLLFEVGLVGFCCFLAVVTRIFILSLQNSSISATLCIGVIAAFMVGCCANSWLLDFSSMHFFVLFIGVLVPKFMPQKNK